MNPAEAFAGSHLEVGSRPDAKHRGPQPNSLCDSANENARSPERRPHAVRQREYAEETAALSFYVPLVGCECDNPLREHSHRNRGGSRGSRRALPAARFPRSQEPRASVSGIIARTALYPDFKVHVAEIDGTVGNLRAPDHGHSGKPLPPCWRGRRRGGERGGPEVRASAAP